MQSRIADWNRPGDGPQPQDVAQGQAERERGKSATQRQKVNGRRPPDDSVSAVANSGETRKTYRSSETIVPETFEALPPDISLGVSGSLLRRCSVTFIGRRH